MNTRAAQTVEACRPANLRLGRDQWGASRIAAHRRAKAVTA
jgi:hypothetical protein